MPQLTIEQAFQLALRHHQSGRLSEAEQIYRQILTKQPRHPDALHLLGAIALQTGRHDLAVDLIRQSIALNPRYPGAHNNLGNALKAQGKFNEAVAAYRHAIALKPNYPEAHCHLGNALAEKGQLDEAVAALHQAVALKPAYAEAHSNLANALKNQGRLDEAISSYRQAIALKPNFSEAHGNLVFTLYYHPHCDARAIADEHLRWNRQHAEPLRQFILPHPNDRDPRRRLRIGYVSSDFRAHVSAFFLVPLLEHHDPQQFELFCYAQVRQPDEITRRLQQHVPQWRSTVNLSDEQLAHQIRHDRIDILVDLKLHTEQNRLLVFARKPAPVQMSWLGFPGSTGLSTIDYRLSDPFLDPPAMDESIYSEKNLRLPHTFWCYDPLDNRDFPINPLPALANNFLTFGCLNNFYKTNDAVLGLWAKLLHAVPSSRLLLLVPQGSARRHVLELFAQEQIAPDRIEFAPRQSRQKYLELYHRIDLSLDTFPYNGHTTSLDSLYMGVPVVTLIGQTAVGRAGLNQLSNLALPELIASTPQQYLHIAATLAQDLPRLQSLRTTLRDRMQNSPLMNAPQFARDIESAYRQAWQTWCAQP